MSYESYQALSAVEAVTQENQALRQQVESMSRQLDAMRQGAVAAQVNRAIVEAVERELAWPLSARDKQAFGASIAAQVASDPASLDKVLAGDVQGAIAPHVAREKEHFDNQLRQRWESAPGGGISDGFDEAALEVAKSVAKMTGKSGF